MRQDALIITEAAVLEVAGELKCDLTQVIFVKPRREVGLDAGVQI